MSLFYANTNITACIERMSFLPVQSNADTVKELLKYAQLA